MYDFRTTRIYYSDLSVQLGDYTATLDYAGCDEPWAWTTVRHSHTNYELHIISRGKGTLVTDEGKFEINGGTIYMTGPGVYTVSIPAPTTRWTSARGDSTLSRALSNRPTGS